jgi:hypothetical protein
MNVLSLSQKFSQEYNSKPVKNTNVLYELLNQRGNGLRSQTFWTMSTFHFTKADWQVKAENTFLTDWLFILVIIGNSR